MATTKPDPRCDPSHAIADTPLLVNVAERVRQVYAEARAALGDDLGGHTLLDLLADQIPDLPLRTLEDAIVVAGLALVSTDTPEKSAEEGESGGLTEEWVARYRHALAHRPVVRALTEAESNVAKVVNECRPAIEYYYNLPNLRTQATEELDVEWLASEYGLDMGEILKALDEWHMASETFLASLKDTEGLCAVCSLAVGEPVKLEDCSSLTHVSATGDPHLSRGG